MGPHQKVPFVNRFLGIVWFEDEHLWDVTWFQDESVVLYFYVCGHKVEIDAS